MAIELLTHRVKELEVKVDQGAGELNKLLGRLEEARIWLQHAQYQAEQKNPESTEENHE